MSERIEVDVDHWSPEFNLDEIGACKALRDRCPVVYNRQHGGYWLVTGYEEAAIVSRDGATYAHRYEPDADDGIDYIGTLGVPRPEGQPGIALNESDGPDHLELRRALNPYFSPSAVESLVPFVEQVAAWFMDQRIADGQMDLVLDFTSPIPAITTLKIMGLPVDNWEYYAELFHASTAFPPESAEYQHGLSRAKDVVQHILESAEELRRNPRGDVTSLIVNYERNGRKFDGDELVALMWNFMAGGIDTTTSSTSWTLHHLAQHPALRQQLIDQPELYDAAVEEFIRYFSVAQTLSRTVTQDTVLGGQQLEKSDRLIINYVGANHDPREFDRPDEIVLDRDRNRHIAFGFGPHRCIGSTLARVMSRIMLKEVLTRIPDYTLESPEPDQYMGFPAVTGLKRLPVRFTPGAPVGASRPY